MTSGSRGGRRLRAPLPAAQGLLRSCQRLAWLSGDPCVRLLDTCERVGVSDGLNRRRGQELDGDGVGGVVYFPSGDAVLGGFLELADAVFDGVNVVVDRQDGWRGA